MDQSELISNFNDLSNGKGVFEQLREDLYVFKNWNWSYSKALKFQKISHGYVQEHLNKKIIILCNHPTCFTMGRGLQKKSGKVIKGLVPMTEMSRLPFPCYKINRGGGLTYHYPGQLIIYPVLRLGGKNPSLSKLSELLFDSIIQSVGEYSNVKLSKKRGDLIGLWTDGLPSQKVASFGIGIERLITQHGISVNIENGEIFETLHQIYPCGLDGKTYGYFNQISNSAINIDKVSFSFIKNLKI